MPSMLRTSQRADSDSAEIKKLPRPVCALVLVAWSHSGDGRGGVEREEFDKSCSLTEQDVMSGLSAETLNATNQQPRNPCPRNRRPTPLGAAKNKN